MCTHPAAHHDVEAPAAQAISIPANSMPSCSTYISTAIIHAIFAIPCPPQHHTQAMQPDLKSVCACRKAANSSHRSCSPTCTASGSRQRVRALQANQMLKRQHRFCHKAASGHRVDRAQWAGIAAARRASATGAHEDPDEKRPHARSQLLRSAGS